LAADTACLTYLELRPSTNSSASGSGPGGDDNSTLTKKLLVANVHLFWDPRRPDVKAVQVFGPLTCRVSPREGEGGRGRGREREREGGEKGRGRKGEERRRSPSQAPFRVLAFFIV
jgi:hypothetical protein